MRLRTLRIWKRFKPLWLFLLGWAAVSVVMLILLGHSLFDVRGGLPKVDVAYSQTIAEPDIRAIDIQAEGITVEVAASYDIRQLQVQLYGTGYINQKVAWQVDDAGVINLRLADYPITANAYGSRYEDDITMRVLLPQKSYDRISIQGQRLHAAFWQCKTKLLRADVAYGSIDLQKARLQQAALISNTSNISIAHSTIHYLNISNLAGDTMLLDNKLRYWKYDSERGNLEALTKKLCGIWELNSERGDIHIGTKKWYQTTLGQTDLLINLHSDTGIVTASSKKKPWKKAIKQALSEHDLHLLEGSGQNMLLVTSEDGNITLDTIKLSQ